MPSVKAHGKVLGNFFVNPTLYVEEQFSMNKNRRSALLYSVAGACFFFVGIVGHDGRSLPTYGNIVAGILFILVAIREYRRKGAQ